MWSGHKARFALLFLVYDKASGLSRMIWARRVLIKNDIYGEFDEQNGQFSGILAIVKLKVCPVADFPA